MPSKKRLRVGFPESNFIRTAEQNRIKFGAFSTIDLINTYIDLAEDNGVDFNENYVWGIRKRRHIIALLKRDFSSTDLRINLQ